MMNGRIFVLMLILFIVSIGTAWSEEDSTFPIPDILKNNVTFWKKIYTEVSLSEGLIHDRDYPMVIYDRVKGDYNSTSVKARKEAITASLRSIAAKGGVGLTKDEEALYAIYKQYGDTSVLKEAADRIRFQMGQKERFREGLERSGLYLDTIRSILSAYKVPHRLAYLPHVESSFNTEAYSKVGAAGLWQFMRGTGKIYGMKIDYTIDERRDPIIATIAAAKYLSSAYAELKSWPLAITSYNHGIYGMKRAVAQTGSSDIAVIIQKYDSRSFRFASSNFYGCFLAASEIADNYTAYFPTATLLPAIKFYDTKLPYFISPDLVCTLFGLTPHQLASLNPAIRSTVFEQKKRLPKGLVLHLPASLPIATIQAAFNNIPDSLRQLGPERSNYYTVSRGDNLYGIASRLGVSVKDLALENNISKYNRIYAGQVLRVPGAAATVVKPVEIASAAKSTTANEKKIVETVIESTSVEAAVEIAQGEMAQISPPEDTVPVVGAVALAVETPQIKSEPSKLVQPKQQQQIEPKKVSKKDTIALNPVEQLSDSLKDIAMAPALPAPEVTSKAKPVLPTVFDVGLYNLDAVLSPGGSRATIFVSIDETIGHYADWLGIPTWQIRKLNDMGRGSNIRVNQKLQIPVNKQDALDRFSSSRLEYHMAIEEDFYAQYMVSDVKSHIVKRGEAIWDFCNEGDASIPLWLLNKYNKQIDLSKLSAGMTVWIPEITELTQAEIDRRMNLPSKLEPQPVRIPLQKLPQKSMITP
jgi:membrane-bound lytic murein transglycosylase D